MSLGIGNFEPSGPGACGTLGCAVGREYQGDHEWSESTTRHARWCHEWKPDPLPSSWSPVDMTAVANGDREPILPTIGKRRDGVSLIYPGREHYVASEPEAGKTWLLLMIVEQHVMVEGGRVLYVDFEDDDAAIGGRLMDLGVTRDALCDPARFVYVRPDQSTESAYRTLLDTYKPTLVILDGITEGYGLWGWDIEKNGDSPKWRQALIRPALDIGAATLASDHVVKAKENRGGFAIGAQHKKAGLTGIAFELENSRPFGRGVLGRSRLWITKDRPGGLRQHGVLGGRGRLTHIGDLVLDDRPDAEVLLDRTVNLTLHPPVDEGDEGGGTRVHVDRVAQAINAEIVQAIRRAGDSQEKAMTVAIVRGVPVLGKVRSKETILEHISRLVSSRIVDEQVGGGRGKPTVLSLPSAEEALARQAVAKPSGNPPETLRPDGLAPR